MNANKPKKKNAKEKKRQKHQKIKIWKRLREIQNATFRFL
jgi:hypothetical protein